MRSFTFLHLIMAPGRNDRAGLTDFVAEGEAGAIEEIDCRTCRAGRFERFGQRFAVPRMAEDYLAVWLRLIAEMFPRRKLVSISSV